MLGAKPESTSHVLGWTLNTYKNWDDDIINIAPRKIMLCEENYMLHSVWGYSMLIGSSSFSLKSLKGFPCPWDFSSIGSDRILKGQKRRQMHMHLNGTFKREKLNVEELKVQKFQTKTRRTLKFPLASIDLPMFGAKWI